MHRLLAPFSLIFLLAACSSYSVRLYPGKKLAPTGSYVVGASRVDITPIMGGSMGGYGPSAKQAVGVWGALGAHAIYIEDPNGQAMAFVSSDLWSMPAGLADRVAELVHEDARCAHLGRDRIIMRATHTHHSPANYSSCEPYNLGASGNPFYDPAMFDYLSRRIALAIDSAVRVKQRAVLSYGRSRTRLLMRNRSAPAIREDSTSELALLHTENSDLERDARIPFGVDSDAYSLIDPTITTLIARDAADTSQVKAIVTFCAVHPVAMGNEVRVFDADIFGVAKDYLGLYFQSTQRQSPIIAFFNGPEGDVSANWHCSCDIAQSLDCQNLAVILGQAVLRAPEHTQPITGNWSWAFSRDSIANQNWHETVLPPHGFIGSPTLGGAIDARNVDYFDHTIPVGNSQAKAFNEPYPTDRSGHKYPADSAMKLLHAIAPRLESGLFGLSFEISPKVLPLEVCRLGPLVW